MRRPGQIRNRLRQPAAAGVSLFPFLAVLICTMGSLILLLVLISRQARLQAAEVAAADESRHEEQLQDIRKQQEQALEDVQWRIDVIRSSRQATREQLADARLELGHIEDHARRLTGEIARLRALLDQISQSGGYVDQRRGDIEQQIARLKNQIAEAERQLEDARRKAAEKPRSFAVVPYQGDHATFRRPIYVECRSDAIVLQPEGVELTVADFSGPMGVDNPLAAALRAVREQLLVQGRIDPSKSGEPYPLLLIRPGGIVAYYAARDAMESWGTEFGYELIGEDWQLAFQPPDPAMAQVVTDAIAQARRRREILAEIAPGRYGGSSEPAEYTVSHGSEGVVRVDGAPTGGFHRRAPSGSFARRFGPAGQTGRHEPSGANAGDNAMANAQSNPGANTGTPRPNETGSILDAPTVAEGSASAEGGTPQPPGQWRPNDSSATDGASGQASRQAAKSLAEKRGAGWAMPDVPLEATAITVPIRVECFADRLVIVGKDGRQATQVVPLQPRTTDSVDELVIALREQVQSWGIAGDGMYWRPVIRAYVQPGGEGRFADLQTLLHRSGLNITRKQ